ncbi:MAG: heme A synthase [Chloroflexi bacterium]|nr:COX15/CtaA family protein [Chloroflexota bacterium]MQC18695.1 heme A synthase [Chloroflexota bacterium]
MSKFQALTIVTVVATVIMIAVGSTVRTTGSGLGCPDWPLCYGGIFPPLEFAAIIEWVHRFIATIISTLVAIQTVGAFAYRRTDPTLWRLALLSVALVAIQAILGGVTVLTGNAPWTVWVHLTMALIFLGNVTMMAALAYLGPERMRIMTPERAKFTRTATLTMWSMAVVLLIGAYTVATDAGFGCTGWPGCPEGQIPFASGERLQHINWTHRFTVAGGFAVVAWLFLHVREMRACGPMLRKGSHSLLGLYGLQIIIGGLTPLLDFIEPIRVAHLAVAAIIWIVMILMWYAGQFSMGTGPATPAAQASGGTRGARA